MSLTNNNSWDVFLHIPSMTFLLKWSEKFRKILNEGRVRITNSVRSNPFPARNLLYRDNDIALVKWPGEGEPLIEFLLGNELQYRIDINNIYESTKLLCFQYTHQNKVIHVSQNMLEYNKDYVFLYNNADVDKILGEYDEIKLNSSGIKARKIKINNIEYSRLRELGFSILKDITFKPIANPTSSNDYVGVYEYPSKEKPTFLVVSNSRINKLRLVLSDDRVLCSLELSDIIPQEKRIIQLSSLKVGNYSLKIEAEIQSEDAIINTNGLVEIYIRDMDSLSVKVKTPLQFYISPYNPTLEDFWEMKYKVKILGPRNYNLTPEISLFDKSKKTIFHTKLSKLSLPVEQKKWIDSFLNFKKNNTQIGRTYDEAYSSELIFADKNLGSVKHSFERNFIPVRWAIKQSQGKYMLKLMIDSDTFEKVDVFRYEFTSPSVKHKIDTEQFKQFSFIEQKGGLYLAEYGGVSKGIIAPSSASRSLQDLYVNHNVIKIARNNLEVINSIENVSIWSSAKQSGNQLAYLHQLQIYYDLTQNLIRTVCGDRWVNEEQLVLDSYPINFIRYKLIPLLQNRSVENYLNNRVNFNNFVESDLLCKIDSLENIFNSVYYFRELKYFKHLYESSSMKTASDFLLRFANSPQRIMELDKEFVNIGIKSILEHPILLKLARVLVIYYRKFYQISDDNFCWGWEWS